MSGAILARPAALRPRSRGENSNHQSAIHAQHLPGDIPGIFVAQKHDSPCNILSRAQTLYRRFLCQSRAVLVGKAGHHVGVNDAGKSTLCRLCNGLIPHSFIGQLTGDVLVNGQSIRDMETAALARSVGSVFSDLRLR